MARMLSFCRTFALTALTGVCGISGLLAAGDDLPYSSRLFRVDREPPLEQLPPQPLPPERGNVAYEYASGPAAVPADPPLPTPAQAPGDELPPVPPQVGGPCCPSCLPANPCEVCRQQAARKQAAANAYAPVFYNNDFDYLCTPGYDDWHLGEELKRNCLGECWVWDVGGQYRARHHSERNIRGLGLTGVDDDFLLHRTRVYANAEYGDRVRGYVEYLDAESNYENFAPRAIEVNRSDLLNAFGDLKLLEARGDLWLRVGRQELIYGNQRLISPLDWANTRRTFDGAKLFWTSCDWNVDTFYARPVIVDPRNFDSPDYDQEFFGTYATYKAVPGETLDLYLLHYNNGSGANRFKYDTLGSRYQGSRDAWLWELEGGYQFGDNTDGFDHNAGFATAGVGRKFEQARWKPTLWFFYDWASGGNQLGAGEGFDHLFPLGHKYMGFMDLFARSNIESPNVQLTMKPHEKLQVTLWGYYLFLESTRDTPYNVNMTPFNPGNAPASAELGYELDALISYRVTPRMEYLFGYSHFFAGDYYRLTPGVPYQSDASFVYNQLTVDF